MHHLINTICTDDKGFIHNLTTVYQVSRLYVLQNDYEY